MEYAPQNNINTGEVFKITRPNGTIVFIEIQSIDNLDAPGPGLATKFTLNPSTHNFGYKLNWHNCYSFGNGVESNRVKDNFNQPFLSPGVRVSTIFEDYKKENRTNGLIFSGIYNNISSVNELNQFIQAENITKETNPTYGSIQKLHARDSDLIVLCEDKVLKVVANKNALYNADGNPELTASKDVLGQAIPYIGEFGISKNPESFASEAYRSYFTDKQRGVVLRLSKDGLTPISLHGMKDYFKDSLKNADKLIGSYDKKKDEYNLTTITLHQKETVSFNENVKGWTSFKSFTPENAIACSGDYYTFDKGELYKHHDESADRNTFYGAFVDSSVNVLLNDGPSHIKTFHTIDYEGSQSKITENTNTSIDTSYYNLEDKPGWYLESLTTDKEYGRVNEFIEKEGKWFNYIKGINEDINTDTDFGSSNIQGAGVLLTTPLIDETDDLGVVTALDDLRLQVNSINTSMQVGDDLYYVKAANLTGNTDPAAIIKYDNTIKEILSTNFPNYTMHEIIVEQANYTLSSPELEQGDFIMFAKNKTINNSSVSGYYADLEFKNNSKQKAELFAVASEISESSK